jgi:DUF1680 family protein
VALIFWAQRMLNLECDGAYADVMEQALYNGALSGLSRDGTRYFYQNPLESDGTHRRWEWHPCPCCTMNVSRLVASIGGYFYATGPALLAVHLYGGNSAKTQVGDLSVGIRQEADYPWSGKVKITLDPETAADFTLKLRVPGWARSHAVSVNGESIEAEIDHGYLNLARRWQAGDVVELDLPMPVERLYAHPEVRADIGRVCLKRGPLVYCVEEIDNPRAPVGEIRLPRQAKLATAERQDLFDGIVAVVAEAEVATTSDWNSDLYRTAPATLAEASITAVPYYLRNNRGPNRMLVWLPES